MSSYSVVVPCFERAEELKITLDSLARQHHLPEATYLVDNNISKSETEQVLALADLFSVPLNAIYTKSPVNSGSVARQIAVMSVQSKYTLFLDSDVMLQPDYTITLIQKLEADKSLLGAQGVDLILQQSYSDSRSSLVKYIFNSIFELLGVSASYSCSSPLKVLPSLCVQNPSSIYNFNKKSEWLSTCAGIFRTNLFKKFAFETKFVKYSWNEYLLLSKAISLETRRFFLFTSTAAYESIVTDSGRLTNIPLMYMAESYDLYIFNQLFKPSFGNLVTYFFSRIGRLLFYLLRAFRRSPLDCRVYHACFHSVFYPLINWKSIKSGDFARLHAKYINI